MRRGSVSDRYYSFLGICLQRARISNFVWSDCYERLINDRLLIREKNRCVQKKIVSLKNCVVNIRGVARCGHVLCCADDVDVNHEFI